MAVLLAPLARAAILGTGRSDPRSATPSNDAEALVVRQTGPVDRARQILLQAGAHEVYQRAGRLADTAPTLPASAPIDTMPVCSPGAAELVRTMLVVQDPEFLPDMLERLYRSGKRLPPALLPDALRVGTRTTDLRPVILAVMGERGRWLAQCNKDWRWATQASLRLVFAPRSGEKTWHKDPAPPADVEQFVTQLLHKNVAMPRGCWADMLTTLPVPWSVRMGTTYTLALRDRVRRAYLSRTNSVTDREWLRSIPIAARALPPECFAQALEPWPIPENCGWRDQEWRQQFHYLTEVIALRRQLLAEEIPL